MSPDAYNARRRRLTPLATRGGGEVADGVVFFCAEAPLVTGETLLMDAGAISISRWHGSLGRPGTTPSANDHPDHRRRAYGRPRRS